MSTQPTLGLERTAQGDNPVGHPPAATPTPQDLMLNVRDRRFGRETQQQRWWLNGDPIASAWFNALSACFPRGEGLFIDAVRHFREGTPPRLEREIRAFIKQEVNHTREHLAFNRAAVDAGRGVHGRLRSYLQECQ